MGKIILAVDESEHSEKAWQFYIDRLRRPDDEVVFVHCAEISLHSVHRVSTGKPHPVTHTADDITPTMIGEVYTKAKSESGVVGSKFEKLAKAKEIPYQVITDVGKPGEAIVAHAAELGAIMVVMGTRGQSKVRRTLLGSVSDYVIRHATCPVVVAKD